MDSRLQTRAKMDLWWSLWLQKDYFWCLRILGAGSLPLWIDQACLVRLGRVKSQILDKVMRSLCILLKGHFNYKASCLSPGLPKLTYPLTLYHDAPSVHMSELILNTPFRPSDWGKKQNFIKFTINWLFCSHTGGISHLHNQVPLTPLKVMY